MNSVISSALAVFVGLWVSPIASQVCNSLMSNYTWQTSLLSEGYVSQNPPPGENIVRLSIYPLDIFEISEATKKYLLSEITDKTFKIYYEFVLKWKDCRVNLPPGKDFTLKDPTILKKLWIPALIYRGCAECDMVTFRKHDFIHVKDGSFILKSRRTIKLQCNLDFHSYPMDRQKCGVRFQMLPYGRPVKLRIDNRQLKMYTETPIQKLVVKDIEVEPCEPPKIKYQNQSCEVVYFHFQRSLSPYIFTIFFPSAIIVFISWLTFWIDPTTAGPRNILGLTAILSLYTLNSSIQGTVPRVSYIKAVDVWMFGCLFTVACSILNFAVAYTIAQKKAKAVKPKIVFQKFQVKKSRWSKLMLYFEEKKWTTDSFAKIVFPSFFAIFNLIFWANYLV